VAHPPCERWGRYWHGGPSARVRRVKGDDNGCFAAALFSVRTWGGVLEHPADSSAWAAFGLKHPPRAGGWVPADWIKGGDRFGWTCCVDQGHYGHRAQKSTWLYAARTQLPTLAWGRSKQRARLDYGYHSAAERRLYSKRLEEKRLTPRENMETPIGFRDVLLRLAQSVETRKGED
jgi:hypothetical protein